MDEKEREQPKRGGGNSFQPVTRNFSISKGLFLTCKHGLASHWLLYNVVLLIRRYLDWSLLLQRFRASSLYPWICAIIDASDS